MAKVLKDLAKPLQNWQSLLQYFEKCSETEVWDLLKYELRHRKRLSFVLRIYGRASNIRLKREKNELLQALTK